MLTTTKRRVLYLSFTLVFVLCAVVILFVASGYRYDWANRRVYRPGLIALSASPKPDAVFLDEKRTQTSSETIRLTDVTPGVHMVRLEKNGYLPWKTTLSVRTGEATTVADIHLFRNGEIVPFTGEVVRFAPALSGARAAIVMQSPPSLVLFDASTGTTSTIIERLTGPIDDLFWKPENDALTIRKTENGTQTIMTVSLTGATTQIPITVYAGDSLQWSMLQQNHLMVLSNGTLSDYDVTKKTRTTIAEDVLAWNEIGNATYVMQSDGNLARLGQNAGETPSTITRLSFTDPVFLPSSPPNTLTVLDRHSRRLALVPLTTPSVPRLFENVTHGVWSTNRRRLAYGNENELFSFTVDTDDPVLLLRSSQQNHGVWWIDDLPYLLVHHGDAFSIFDVRGSGDPIALMMSAHGDAQGMVNATGTTATIFADGAITSFLL